MNDNDEQCFKTQCGIWEERFLGLIAFYLKKKIKKQKDFSHFSRVLFRNPANTMHFYHYMKFRKRENAPEENARGDAEARLPYQTRL